MFDYNEMVKLVKKDGSVIENIPSSITPGLICIDDETVPIEVGDIFERVIPSGLTERWVVNNPGYFGKQMGFGDFPAYQCGVELSTTKPKQNSNPTNVYNINGPNARVNIDSIDASVNTVSENSDKVFNDLIDFIRGNIEDNNELISLVAEMKDAKGQPAFTEKYQKFISNSANHITLLAPFIPVLTQMLSQ